MKTMKSHIIFVLSILLFSVNINAQTDSRNRTKETIVQDGLAQLPAKNLKSLNQVMSEIAKTGKDGAEMLVGMLLPADQAKNATFEYAIDGLVSYVSQPTNKSLKADVMKGLVAGFDKCKDNTNRAFLVSQMKRIATAEDAPFFANLLKDNNLQDAAINALASIEGSDGLIKDLIKNNATPKDGLAYLAYFKKLKGVEDNLLSWTNGANPKTLASVYNALTVCGGNKSLAVLENAAKNVNFSNEATGATDAYLQLLNNSDDNNAVITSAKSLIKNNSSAIRCAGLRLLLLKDKDNAAKNILNALKDPCIEYRNTALDLAQITAGEGIFAQVGAKKFKGGAATDVVRWLGNNKKADQLGVIVKAIQQHKDSTLTRAGIEAIAKINNEQSLQTLISELGGDYAPDAMKALLAYNGRINDGISNALKSSDKNILKNALKLASERHIYNVYNTVLGLTNKDASVKDEAYKALSGVSTTGNFEELCGLMEKATEKKYAMYLQSAAKNAIKSLSSEEQYNLVNKHLSKTSDASLYYPLLAQAGNTNAIKKLTSEFYNNKLSEKAAYKSLLQVDNVEMIDVLYDIAKSDDSKKNETINRYLTLVRKSSNNTLNKYLLYRKALELNPADDVVKRTLSYLTECHYLPTLVLASKYLNNDATAMKAATAVKTIVAKNQALQGGTMVEDLLKKALNVFKAQTNNADAGYAVDEINGQILPKFTEEGFVAVNAAKEGNKIIFGQKKYENFEMYLEWKAKGKATLNLRDMPQIFMSEESLKVNASDATAQTCPDEWNALFVKVVNDRLSIECNGVSLINNFIMKNTPATIAIADNGLLSVLKDNGECEVRELYIKELPSTPIFTLSPEERKAGFEVLFDGRNLDKWQGNLTDYVPLDGNIYVSAKYGGKGNLYTKKTYSDFIYRFDFCFDEPGVNNGIGIRTHIGTDAAYDGMEIQVLDHDDPIYKGLRDYQRHGSVYGIIVPKHIIFDKVGTWYSEEIRAVGDHITVTVNGDVVVDGNIREACQGHNVAPDGGKVNPYTVDHKNHPGLFNKEGYISFCGHGVGVKFRNVRILDLSKKTKSKKKR